MECVLAFENAILQARLGNLHPSIVNPKTFKEKLVSISDLLKNDIILPIPTTNTTPYHTLAKYYKILEIHSECHLNELYFSISIPLIENTCYDLYQMIPFPQPTPDKPQLLSFVNPSDTFLLINREATKFSFLDTLADCQAVSDVYHLCGLATINANINGPCEVELLLNAEQPRCNITYLYGQADIVEPLSTNQWLIIHNHRYTLLSYCDGTKVQHTLPDTCLVELPSYCFAQTGNRYLYPSRSYRSTFAPVFPLSNISLQGFEPPKIPPVRLTPIVKINQMELLAQADQLKEEERILETLFLTPNHVHWTTTICSILFLAFLCLYIYCKCFARQNFMSLRYDASPPATVDLDLQSHLPPTTNLHSPYTPARQLNRSFKLHSISPIVPCDPDWLFSPPTVNLSLTQFPKAPTPPSTY